MVRRISALICLFAAAVFAIAAGADSTSDPCPDTSCPVTCQTGPTPCVVTLKASKSSTTPEVLVNGSSAPLFCAAAGTELKWVPATSTSIYALAFNPKHTPFSHNVFVGDGHHPFSEKVSNHGGTDRCYVYTFVVCSKAGKCQHADPRVVITGP